jgi:hypothetical protein
MKIDGRKHDHKTLEAIRKMAVRRIREGDFWYSVYTGRLNAARFVEFLKDFMRYRRRPVFLVVDGLPAHKAKLVAAYVQFLRGKLELHFLPGYAPRRRCGRTNRSTAASRKTWPPSKIRQNWSVLFSC